ncbi:MAG TPA: L,D-transpeptidase family protein [Candidatus Thiothrix moscowensis]|uniref:L,D-transpeptidase family protein n=1 Tax=unclassified Thiothrix TaxID=2636184 RepID=UPI001A20B545|nr:MULTISPECIES: L,D-transpeptidase family protein [unclassified Thiothrix]MBJ6610785.1 L,D-transpeptidase family protein [Candidatus Thiothrix moscowensis]HRJ51155.1 L,D-transpeptidase family protein [Candidatus Thiothrix moscowensis]HRJ91790.1 L,D-transpeptidase family protein [Candidatus Thiothrix moscowensis]
MKKLLMIICWFCLSTAVVWASTPGTYWVDVETSLTVRSAPAANGASLGSLGRNAEVQVARFVGAVQTIGGRSGQWAEISYAGGRGYVFGGFLKSSAGSASHLPDHTAVLTNLQVKYPAYYANGVFLVDDSEQRMYWYDSGELVRSYVISTAAKGLGAQAESEKTPPGAHRISTKIGKNAKRGAIFEKLTDTGRVAKIYTRPEYSVKALVLSRILRLDGLEPGKNKGGNVDTFNRMIYFHGTNKEGNLGKRASHGCIRMANDEIMDLFGRVSVDTLVYIQP